MMIKLCVVFVYCLLVVVTCRVDGTKLKLDAAEKNRDDSRRDRVTTTSGLGHRTAQQPQSDEFSVDPTAPMYYPGGHGYHGGYYASYPTVNPLPYPNYSDYYNPYHPPQSVSERKEEPGSSTSHGHGHGHNHGHRHAKHAGGGGGHGGGQTTRFDASAMGLVSLIALLSLLQTVLRSLTTTTTTARTTGRKKRHSIMMTAYENDGDHNSDDDNAQKVREILLLVLPSLNLMAHARTGGIPMECTGREICLLNKLLVHKLGTEGENVGSIMSSVIVKLLKEIDHDKRGNDTMMNHSLLTRAGVVGRQGGDCEVFYHQDSNHRQKCLKKLPLLMKPSHFIQFGVTSQHLALPCSQWGQKMQCTQ